MVKVRQDLVPVVSSRYLSVYATISAEKAKRLCWVKLSRVEPPNMASGTMKAKVRQVKCVWRMESFIFATVFGALRTVCCMPS